MKKLLLLFAAIALIGSAYAQTDSANKKMSPVENNKTKDGLNQNRDWNNNTNDDMNQNRDQNNKTKDGLNQNQDINNYETPKLENNSMDKSHPDGVMMQDGKIMKVKNGQMTILEDDMTMNNGTKVMSDGTCIKKDGSKTTMKEGQHMDMSGDMTPEKENKDKNMYSVPDSTIKKE